MRTKTLLIAAAALAATVISSQAQVYSGIVGYASVVLPAGPSYTLLANPFDNGSGNLATNYVDPNGTLPNKTQILTWNGASFNSLLKSGGAWPAGAATTAVPPGTGFFVVLPATQITPVTNTFTGAIVLSSGGSITNVVPSGYSLWGSPVPYSGDLISNTNIGAPTIGSILNVNKSQILTWNGVSYNSALYSSGTWGAQTAPINVGAGFFIFNKSATPTNWVQNAPF